MCDFGLFFSFFSGFLSEEKFPAHLKNLVQKIQEEEENEKRAKEIERNTCKVRDYFSYSKKDYSSR